VRKEADAALNAHGLIKVRVFGDDRAAREPSISNWRRAERRAHPAHRQAAGAVAPQPEKEKAFDEDRMPGPRDVKVLKFGRAGQRPRSSSCACWATSA
jgi:hypothetical protein